MKAWEYEIGCTRHGDIVCIDCISKYNEHFTDDCKIDDTNPNDFTPYFAVTEVVEYPICDVCHEQYDYMIKAVAYGV